MCQVVPQIPSQQIVNLQKKIDSGATLGVDGKRCLSNLSLTHTEATATVSNVADTVSDEAFEGNSDLLLDADYLKAMDTVSTGCLQIIQSKL